MNTKNLVQERISVFADGETSDEQLDIALAEVRSADGKAAWELYHQIGDLLRSDEMAMPLSAGFSASMAARLANEPVLIAPVARRAQSGRSGIRRLALPGVLAAAAAAVAFVGTPQLMVAMQGTAPSAVVAVASDSGVARTALDGNVVRAGSVLRDQGIDEYMMAHQRFSPSVYSSAQYARSATFANESGK